MKSLALLLALSALAPGSAPPSPKKVDKADQQEAIDRLTHELEKIDRAIDETKQIVRKSLDAPYLPDLYFHLAELYVQRSRFEHARGLQQQGDGAHALTDERSMVVTLSKKLAVETYEKLLTDYPEYEHRDEIYFFKGHEFRELGEWEPMFKEYSTLMERYPKSKWALQARLIVADHHFDKGEYDDAEKYYKEILLQAESIVHPTARYKLGWIRINQQNFKEALGLFREAVLTSDSADARNKKLLTGGKSVNVRREALMAMAWPYSETHKPSQALAYFRQLADSKGAYIDVLKKLGTRYSIKNKGAAAALVYREVVRLSSEPEENLAYVPQIVNAVGELPDDKPARYLSVEQDVAGMTDTLTRLLDRPDAVRKRPDAPAVSEPKLTEEFELHARDLATRAHKFAQDANDKRLEQLSANAYTHYLATFPHAKEFETLELDRAGALFDATNYLPSAMQYEKVAGSPKGKAKQTDVYNAIVAYYRALDEDAKHRIADAERLGTLDKLELMRAREGLKQLGAFYVKKYPTSEHVPDVRFNISRMYYQQGEFQRSVELFTAFIQQHPTHKDVPTAGRLALDALYKLEKLDEMAVLADSFAKNGQIADSDFKAEAGRLADAARRRKVEFTVIGTSDADFSKKMLNEFEKHKGTKEGEQYLYAGFSKYKSQGDIANTFSFGDKLVGAYPNSRWAPEVVSTMGNFAAQVADFERAAFMYEEYQKRYSRERGSIDLLKSAADMRMLLGESRQAEQDLTTLRQVGSAEQKAQAASKLLELYAGQASWGQLNVAANSFLQEDKTVATCFYAGLAALKQGDGREARQHFACAARAPAQLEADEALQARAVFELARATHANFSAVEYHGAGSAEQVLRQKLALETETEQAYLQAIRGGDSQWAMASTFELSRLYRELGTFISEAPAPAGVAADQYKAALQEQADPFFDKAKQTLAACAQKSEQLKLLTAYGSACMAGTTTEVEEKVTVPLRSAGAQDPHYTQDLDKLRQGLTKNLKNTEVLKSMARRALTARDYHYARLVLSAIQEAGGKPIDSWMGLVLWQLGEPQAAVEALEKGRRGGSAAAGLNLAALYASYGYKKMAKQVMPDAASLQGLDMNSFEVHPAARHMGGKGGEE